MTLQERAKWTKAKIEESCKQNEDTMTIRYWVGYLDGLIAALSDENTRALAATEPKGDSREVSD